MRKRKRLFTNNQYKRMSNVLDNIGQVILAAVIVPTLLGVQIDGIDSSVLLWRGIFGSGLSWWLSIRLERITK